MNFFAYTARKATKIGRKWKWRLKRSDRSVPLWWHVGFPNFGDDFNPVLFEKIFNRSVHLAKASRPHMLGAGSILAMANHKSVICGSGFLHKDQSLTAYSKIISVRGKKSASRIPDAKDVWIGDPFVLIGSVSPLPHGEKKWELALIPHVDYFRRNQKFAQIDCRRPPPHIKVIDMGGSFPAVLEGITQCKFVASQSLHGLIIADSFQVPSIWIQPSESMVGGEFKFEDYFSTTDTPKKPISVRDLNLDRIEKHDPFVSNYLFDKGEYLSRLQSALSSLVE